MGSIPTVNGSKWHSNSDRAPLGLCPRGGYFTSRQILVGEHRYPFLLYGCGRIYTFADPDGHHITLHDRAQSTVRAYRCGGERPDSMQEFSLLRVRYRLQVPEQIFCFLVLRREESRAGTPHLDPSSDGDLLCHPFESHGLKFGDRNGLFLREPVGE